MLSAIENALKRAGIQYRHVRIYRTDSRDPETVPAIMASHDYTGPYPPKDTWNQISMIRRIAERHHARTETRGFYTATLIYQEDARNEQ